MEEKAKEGIIEGTVKDIKIKKEKTKLSKEASQEILKKIFKNILRAIGIMIYFVVLNLAYNKINQERLINDIQVFSGMFLLVGIICLEKAYKNDNGETAVTAIELLFISLHSLSIMHFITLFKYDFRVYLVTSAYVFSIYYVLKSIIIYTKGRKEYLNTLSDISEIVKKDEPIKKEAKKRNESIEEDNKNLKKEENKEEKNNDKNDKKVKKEVTAKTKKKKEKSKKEGKSK